MWCKLCDCRVAESFWLEETSGSSQVNLLLKQVQHEIQRRLLRTLSKVESQKLPKPETWQYGWAPCSSADFPCNETFVFPYIQLDHSLFLRVTTVYCSSTMHLIKEPSSVFCYLLLAIRRLLLGFTQDFSSSSQCKKPQPNWLFVCFIVILTNRHNWKWSIVLLE